MIEDFELVANAKAGDENSLTELLTKYKPLVSLIARKYFLIGAEPEDLVQEGMIGLYKAYLSFNQNDNVEFKTFASLCITRQIKSALKAANRIKNVPLNTYLSINNQGQIVVSVNEDDEENEEKGIYLPSNSLSPEDRIIYNENLDKLRLFINNELSDFERQVLIHYFEGLSYSEISEKVGKTPKSIDNALSRIKLKFREIYFEE